MVEQSQGIPRARSLAAEYAERARQAVSKAFHEVFNQSGSICCQVNDITVLFALQIQSLPAPQNSHADASHDALLHLTHLILKRSK